MKHAIISILMLSPISAATLVTTLRGDYVTSSVFFEDGNYIYQYEVDENPLDGKRDLSHISLTVCDPHELVGLGSDDGHTIEIKEDTIKFDNLSPEGTFKFWFVSDSPWEIGDARLKAGTVVGNDLVLAPRCVIPEPNYASLALGTMGLLLITRKRV